MTNPDPIARIAEHSADYVFGHYESVRPRDMFELALLHAALDAVTGAKAAIRAEVAEEIAAAIDAEADRNERLPWAASGGLITPAVVEAHRRDARIAREHTTN